MPERVLLRYFDCLGRAQPLRNALVDAGVTFEDQRIAIGVSWRALKEQADGGPFGSLPVLEWGDDCVAQALPIAGYLARRLGHYDGLDAMGIARLEMVASAAYLDVIAELAMMLWVSTTLSDAEAAARFSNHEARILHKVDRFDRMLASSGDPFFGGQRPAVADFFVVEALDMTRAVIGERLDAALGRAPRLAEMRERLARRDAIARYVGDGKRPTRLTGSPNEAESLARIRQYVETQVGVQP
jgi:glutathione S-transferase